MSTKEYLNVLRSNGREASVITMRYAVYLYLIKHRMSHSVIADIFKCSKRNIYYCESRMQGFIDTKDYYAMKALEELSNHTISVRPKSRRRANGLCMFVGYELLIDNEIF